MNQTKDKNENAYWLDIPAKDIVKSFEMEIGGNPVVNKRIVQYAKSITQMSICVVTYVNINIIQM